MRMLRELSPPIRSSKVSKSPRCPECRGLTVEWSSLEGLTRVLDAEHRRAMLTRSGRHVAFSGQGVHTGTGQGAKPANETGPVVRYSRHALVARPCLLPHPRPDPHDRRHRAEREPR